MYILYQSLVSICVPPSVLVALYVVNYVVINVLELPGTTLQLHHVEIDVVNDVWKMEKTVVMSPSPGQNQKP